MLQIPVKEGLVVNFNINKSNNNNNQPNQPIINLNTLLISSMWKESTYDL